MRSFIEERHIDKATENSSGLLIGRVSMHALIRNGLQLKTLVWRNNSIVLSLTWEELQ